MTSPRDAFLQRVRAAVVAGNQAGQPRGLLARGAVGFQGGGLDPVQRFGVELRAAGGFPYVVPSAALSIALVQELLDARAPRRVLLGRGAFLDKLQLARHLREPDREIVEVTSFRPG